MKKGSVRDKHYTFEKPDEAKVSCPVLKPREEGQPSTFRGNQVKRSPIMEQRIIVYLDNMVKDQSCEGFKYKDIKKSVSIIIAAEHNVTDDERYFHKYSMRDEKDNSQFTDLLEIDILELKNYLDPMTEPTFGIGFNS